MKKKSIIVEQNSLGNFYLRNLLNKFAEMKKKGEKNANQVYGTTLHHPDIKRRDMEPIKIRLVIGRRKSFLLRKEMVFAQRNNFIKWMERTKEEEINQ